MRRLYQESTTKRGSSESRAGGEKEGWTTEGAGPPWARDHQAMSPAEKSETVLTNPFTLVSVTPKTYHCLLIASGWKVKGFLKSKMQRSQQKLVFVICHSAGSLELSTSILTGGWTGSGYGKRILFNKNRTSPHCLPFLTEEIRQHISITQKGSYSHEISHFR